LRRGPKALLGELGPQARAKTDRLDARALAKLLWAGEPNGVWTPDERVRAMRRRLALKAEWNAALLALLGTAAPNLLDG
jgi:hypothetical protein